MPFQYVQVTFLFFETYLFNILGLIIPISILYCLNLLFVLMLAFTHHDLLPFQYDNFDCELTYLRTISLRIFFESMPKINFSGAELIFLPGFWEHC